MKHRYRPSPALAVSVVALFVALGGVGVAATGGNFILGQSNTADATTGLSGSVSSSSMLQVTNSSSGGALRGDSAAGRGVVGQHTGATGAAPGIEAKTSSADPGGSALSATNSGGGVAAKFNVGPSSAPFSVNSSALVPNLNADRLDGFEATSLRPTLITYNQPANTGTTTFGNVGALQLRGGCDATGDLIFEVQVDSGIIGGLVHVTLTTASGTTYREIDSLAANTPFDVVGTTDDNVVGTLVRFNGSGAAQTVTFLAEEENGRCKIGGTGLFAQA